MKKYLTLLAIAFVILIHPVSSLAGQGGRQVIQEVSDVSLDELSALEIENLTYMREEEKLARDVYLTMFETWGLSIFENIASSEQSHTDAVAKMLDKYKLPDPVVDDRIGIFMNQKLADLYETLLAHGYQSSLEALFVGGLIEEVDMVDLKRAIEETDNEDIRELYESLLRGSRNHLRAFVGQIENLGLVYEAQFLSQEEVDAIVDSPMERSSASRS